MSEVQIANMALYRVGSSIRIATLDESTERNESVRASAFWYPIDRDAVLQSAPWGFARKSVALAAVTDTTFPGWNYVYEYPSDCLQAVAVCDAGGMRNFTYWGPYWPGQEIRGAPAKVPFQIGSRDDGDSNVIMTDIAEAYLFYIFRQEVTNTFSPLFIDALAWKLGADIGQTVQANQARIDRCAQMYELKVRTALAQALNEAQPDMAPDSPSIQVRGW